MSGFGSGVGSSSGVVTGSGLAGVSACWDGLVVVSAAGSGCAFVSDSSGCSFWLDAGSAWAPNGFALAVSALTGLAVGLLAGAGF
jgi:hypothetical protein